MKIFNCVLDRVRVPFFFILMALLAIVNPSKAMRLTYDTLDGK